MKYCGIDLHSNNSVVVVSDEEDRIVFNKRLPNDLGQIRAALEAHQDELAGVVINAGAYTHTSIALHDATKGTGITLIELHISNVHAREPFRHHSYLSAVARAVMCGFGVPGYGLAIDALAQML